jgi:ABC-type transporter Mla subunit MlaD
MTDVARPEGLQAQIAGVAEQAQTKAVDLAKTAATAAQQRARELAEEQKSAAAQQIEDVARTVDEAAAAVERALPQAAPYVRQAASTVRAASSALRDRSVDDLIDMATDFARRRPAAVTGLSLFAGFAIARFLKASADRRDTAMQERSARHRNQRAATRRPPDVSSPANTRSAGGPSSSGPEGTSASPSPGTQRNPSDGQ